MRATPSRFLAALVPLALAVAAGTTGGARRAAGERTIYMAAIEPKGSATVDKEPFPTEALPAGGGYGLEGPDEKGAWTVETYRWLPSGVTVVQGDKVTLEILGVNGAMHASKVEGYDIAFDVKRGQVTRVTFTADKAGVFRIICSTHQPAMTGTLVVLPSS